MVLPAPSHLPFRRGDFPNGLHFNASHPPSLPLSTGKHLGSLDSLPKLSSFQVAFSGVQPLPLFWAIRHLPRVFSSQMWFSYHSPKHSNSPWPLLKGLNYLFSSQVFTPTTHDFSILEVSPNPPKWDNTQNMLTNIGLWKFKSNFLEKDVLSHQPAEHHSEEAENPQGVAVDLVDLGEWGRGKFCRFAPQCNGQDQ